MKTINNPALEELIRKTKKSSIKTVHRNIYITPINYNNSTRDQAEGYIAVDFENGLRLLFMEIFASVENSRFLVQITPSPSINQWSYNLNFPLSFSNNGYMITSINLNAIGSNMNRFHRIFQWGTPEPFLSSYYPDHCNISFGFWDRTQPADLVLRNMSGNSEYKLGHLMITIVGFWK